MNTRLKLLLRKVANPAFNERLAMGVRHHLTHCILYWSLDPAVIGNDRYFVTSLSSGDQ
ncbi:hypothetical protein D3C78_1682740 [compost metagenome]